MSVEEALAVFKQHDDNMKQSLRRLREEVKREGSIKIQKHMLEDDFVEANKIMKLLEEIVQVNWESNSEKITTYIRKMFVEGESTSALLDKTHDKNELREEETLILRDIYQTNASKVSELNHQVSDSVLWELKSKGWLNVETVNWKQEQYLVFNLTDKAIKMVQSLSPTTTKTDVFVSKSEELHREEKNEPLFISNEQKLSSWGFQVVNSTDYDAIEFLLDEKSCYLIHFTKETIEEKLNTYSHLKNLAFIFNDKAEAQKALSTIYRWVDKNTKNSRYMTINIGLQEELSRTKTFTPHRF